MTAGQPESQPGQPPDLRTTLAEVKNQLAILETRARAARTSDAEVTRGLYRLRATVAAQLDDYDLRRHHRADRDENDVLRRALDIFNFTAPDAEPLVHVTRPDHDREDPGYLTDRTLCGLGAARVHAKLPDGRLCPTCASAFVRALFASGRDRP